MTLTLDLLLPKVNISKIQKHFDGAIVNCILLSEVQTRLQKFFSQSIFSIFYTHASNMFKQFALSYDLESSFDKEFRSPITSNGSSPEYGCNASEEHFSIAWDIAMRDMCIYVLIVQLVSVANVVFK